MKKVTMYFLFLSTLSLLFISNTYAQKTNHPISDIETGIQYLSGTGFDDAVEWEFMVTDGRRAGEWTTIPVPSCWELHGFGTYQYGMPFYGVKEHPGIAAEKGNYKYRFKLPKEWEGRVVRIVYDGVMTDYEAKINGRRCGNRHQGAFYRFKSDVSDRIFFGEKENLLEITVSKESSNTSVNLAERRGDYWNFGGIFRPVFVEALPIFHIDRIAIDAKADGRFYADVFLGTAVGDNAKIEAQLIDEQGKKIGKPIETTIRRGSDKGIIDGRFSNIKQWTAETPNLYTIQFTLKDGEKILHTLKERFGFRTIEVKESDGIYINGQKILAKGVNRHSFRPESGRTLSRKANYDDVKLIKEMNMNAVRLSHYPSDPEFLEACDELGLYVIVELTGWHGKYDTAVGKELVYEMVTRDVNHPSVIWWANGNEKGWNTELDKEFAPLDPQKRPLLHPQGNFGGFETMHYRSYGESQEYMRKPEIFMPTEFLHGLYDGGHGAGLWDYWEMMRNHPRCAGGFLWDFADEGVVRTDQNGRIDNVGNYAADGIVGPHHEKEGSFFTIKQVWSPVQIMNESIDLDFNGVLTLENRYDFLNLNGCTFKWSFKKFSDKEEVVHSGTIKGPNVAPHSSGTIKIPLPANWQKNDALSVTAYDANNHELWTWDWEWKNVTDYYPFEKERSALSVDDQNSLLNVKTGNTSLFFDKSSGTLSHVLVNAKKISFGEGPQFFALRRGDRSMDMFYNHDDKDARKKERIYEDISGENKLMDFSYKQYDDSIIVLSEYFGNMRSTKWTIQNDGTIKLDYSYQYDGTVELMGVKFNYPEDKVLSKKWLGQGPFRVWKNRIHGTNFGLWENDYNDPIPGETFLYPEFKGYFKNWKWASINTTEGAIHIANGGEDDYLGIYSPRDGRDALLYTFPDGGISVLKVIPAVRNKVNTTDLIGPSSQAVWAKGLQQGTIYLRFTEK
ncbi:MAG: glycoside hydrolase family 2 [Bacteroidales bacterium]|nr:glycoside hydrolase family 2 [Bacteroidales bacterium]